MGMVRPGPGFGNQPQQPMVQRPPAGGFGGQPPAMGTPFNKPTGPQVQQPMGGYGPGINNFGAAPGGGYGMPQQPGMGQQSSPYDMMQRYQQMMQGLQGFGGQQGGYGMPPQPMGGRRDPFKPLIQLGPGMPSAGGTGMPQQPGMGRGGIQEFLSSIGRGGYGMPFDMPQTMPGMNQQLSGTPPIGQPMDRQEYDDKDAAYQAQRSQYEQFMAKQGGQPLAGRLGPQQEDFTISDGKFFPRPQQEDFTISDGKFFGMPQQPQVARNSGGYNPNTGQFTPPSVEPLMPQQAPMQSNPMQYQQVMRPPAMPQAPNRQQIAFESPRMQAMRNMQRRGGPNR